MGSQAAVFIYLDTKLAHQKGKKLTQEIYPLGYEQIVILVLTTTVIQRGQNHDFVTIKLGQMFNVRFVEYMMVSKCSSVS